MLPLFVVAVLTAIGVALRLAVAGQSLFADEMSTYWIVSRDGLWDVVSLVGHRYPNGATAEISPPLYFALAWLTTKLGHAPELLRAPSLLAGGLTIPVVYVLGLRTIGRAGALVAAALTALSPFMIFYSGEARAYAVMMLFVLLSTVAMLRAVDGGATRWWVAYGAFSCLAMYSHYTCVFVLVAQLAWLMVVHPEARRPALLATLGAAIAFLPWLPGLRNELRSTTTGILSALTPFSARDVRLVLGRWAIGSPLSDQAAPLRKLPGTFGLELMGLALVLTGAGWATAVARGRGWRTSPRSDRRIALVLVLALSVPVGAALVSSVSTHLFGVRNLAASWPFFALLLAWLLMAAGPRLRWLTAALAVASFALGAMKMLDERYQRPNFQAAARFIDGHAGPGDVVLDESGFFSPGPTTPMDAALRRAHPVFRAASPEERSHPFTKFDPVTSFAQAAPKAVAAGGEQIFLLFNLFFPVDRTLADRAQRGVPSTSPFQGYHAVETRVYPGVVGTAVQVYSRSK